MLEKLWIWLMSFVSKLWLERVTSRQNLDALAVGVGLQIFVIGLLIWAFLLFRKSKFALLFEMAVESIYEFFEEILEETWKRWIKTYVVTLFFIILLSNLSSWLLDFVRVIFSDIERLSSMVVLPTSSFEFNTAVAVVSILLFLVAQFKHLWIWKFFYEYLPLWWKWILDIQRSEVKSVFVYWPAKIIIKTFDIIISLFVGILDIVWVLAKVVSLAARLYWNMIAWGILLGILIVWLNSATQGIFGQNFPIIAPLLLYLQWLLVALIQAFVFPLLVWIFMKLAQSND